MTRLSLIALLFVTVFFAGPAFCAMMPWLDAIDIGGTEVQSYYSSERTALDFSLGGPTLKSINCERYSFTTKYSFRPAIGFSAYAKIGVAGSSLVSTSGYDQKWSGHDGGIVSGAGINYVLGRDAKYLYNTVIDAGVNYLGSRLNLFYTGETLAGSTNQSLNLWELYGGLLFTRIFTLSDKVSFSPYAGACLSFYRGYWKDLDNSLSFTEYLCEKTAVMPLLGFVFSVKNAGFRMEFDLTGTAGISAGFCYGFIDNR